MKVSSPILRPRPRPRPRLGRLRQRKLISPMKVSLPFELPTSPLELVKSIVSVPLKPLTNILIEKDRAPAGGAALASPIVLEPSPVLAREYVEGDWMRRTPRALPKLVVRGVGCNRTTVEVDEVKSRWVGETSRRISDTGVG